MIGGDETGQNLRGILNTSGIANIAFAAGVTPDLVLDGIGAVLMSGAEPNVVALCRAGLDRDAEAEGDPGRRGTFRRRRVRGDRAGGAWGTARRCRCTAWLPGTALVGDTRLGGRVLGPRGRQRHGVRLRLGRLRREPGDAARRGAATAVVVEAPAAWGGGRLGGVGRA